MIESTSSWTNASGSNANVLMAKGTIDERNAAPGMSACFASHASRREAMPLACGIPPIPGGWSITRLLSVIANWPSRKKPSRGSVAIQLGLPRPAFRNAACVVLELSLASLINSFLISNGLKASNLRRVNNSAIANSHVLSAFSDDSVQVVADGSRLGQQHDKDHAPDRQQRVPDGVGDSVAKARDLALGPVVNHAERGGGRAPPGDAAQHDRVVEAKQILSNIHRQDERQGRCENAPEEQAEAELLQPRDELGTRREADDGDEDVQADRIHEPHRGGGDREIQHRLPCVEGQWTRT